MTQGRPRRTGQGNRRDTSSPPAYRGPMSAPVDIDVRPVTEAEYPEWLRAVHAGFLREPVVSEAELEARERQFEPGRLLGAFDGDRCVATFRSFAQEVTAVGGEFVTADAISAVTVTATHRRRGLLTRMMSRDLAAAKERGDVPGDADRRRV